MAWISAGKDTGPSTRFNTKSQDGYKRTDGAMIAASWNKLLETDTTPLLHPINRDENNAELAGETLVWTNTDTGGSSQTSTTCCDAWVNDTAPGAVYGDASKVTASWTLSVDFVKCETLRHLYCFEQ